MSYTRKETIDAYNEYCEVNATPESREIARSGLYQVTLAEFKNAVHNKMDWSIIGTEADRIGWGALAEERVVEDLVAMYGVPEKVVWDYISNLRNAR